jgi:hypothetical protein
MVQVNYDMRPVDTEVIVYTRNRIRLFSALNIFGILLYLNIAPSFVQTHVSWIHLLHILTEPFILFVSIADNSMITYGALVVSICTLVTDIGVLILNYIAVQRCLSEPSASCTDRLYENGSWFLLAAWMTIFNIVTIIQLYLLKTQLEQKDKTEKQNIEEQKSGGDPPTWNSIEVYTNKMIVNAIFLLLLDVCQIGVTSSIYSTNPMFILSATHILVDLFSILTVRKTKDTVSLNIVRTVFITSLLINIMIMTLSVQLDMDTIGKVLSILITITYVVTDMMQILYSSIVITTIANYKQYKNKK